MELTKNSQIFLMLVSMLSGMAWFLLSMYVFAPNIGLTIGIIGYIVLIMTGTVGIQIIAKEMVSSYPYLSILIRPSNEILDVFIANPSYSRKLAQDLYVSTLTLKFPIMFENQKYKTINLFHEGQWASRIKFRPGHAVWNGLPFGHPQTEIIEATRVLGASYSLSKGEPALTLKLKSSSLDYERSQFQEHARTKENLEAYVDSLEFKLAEATRQKLEWHQKAIAYEEAIEQLKAETRGLLESKTNIKALAFEYMLKVYQAYGSIDKAVKALKPSRFSFKLNSLYAGLIIIGLVAAVLVIRPEFLTGLGIWLSNSTNQVYTLVLAVVLAAASYAVFKRKRGE